MKAYHLIGIGGIGMSALARLLKQRNCQVTGSDLRASTITKALEGLGIPIFYGHKELPFSSDATIVYSSAIKSNNPELVEAKKKGNLFQHRSELLQSLAGERKALAVTGSHGKTTTSSLLVSVLIAAKKHPSYALGGVLREENTNASSGHGPFFVIEADESDGSFLRYYPYGAICTNIDLEHMDHYLNEKTLIESFLKFSRQVKHAKHFFWSGDCPRLQKLDLPGFSYGFHKACDIKIKNFFQEGFVSFFDLDIEGVCYKNIKLNSPGRHQVKNAAAVFALALSLGVDEQSIRVALSSFQGVSRRFEPRFDSKSLQIYDDYAHHPTEIKAVLQTVRKSVGEKRVLAVFQPHRFSRLSEHWDAFSTAFSDADLVIVTDVYAASEASLDGISGKKLADAMRKKGHPCVLYYPFSDLFHVLLKHIRPFDFILTLGAGNIEQVGCQLKEFYQKKSPPKLKVGLLCGGVSLEHSVSLDSAKYIHHCLSQDLYDISICAVTKEGKWVQADDLPEKKVFEKEDERKSLNPVAVVDQCDVLIPCFHGPLGEDGAIQGFLELMGKPYVGCDYGSCAVCMNKVWTKQILLYSGIHVAAFMHFSRYEWSTDQKSLLHEILRRFTFPFYVKPVHLGSSIGVSCVHSYDELIFSVEKALSDDKDVLIEERIVGREIEFAVLGNDQVFIPRPAEVHSQGKTYAYGNKYGENQMKTSVEAFLSKEKIEEGQSLAQVVYKELKCSGLARVDFFLDEKGVYYVNEVNPFPGFTSISLYPKVWENQGVLGPELINRLIILAMHRFRSTKTSQLR